MGANDGSGPVVSEEVSIIESFEAKIGIGKNREEQKETVRIPLTRKDKEAEDGELNTIVFVGDAALSKGREVHLEFFPFYYDDGEVFPLIKASVSVPPSQNVYGYDVEIRTNNVRLLKPGVLRAEVWLPNVLAEEAWLTVEIRF